MEENNIMLDLETMGNGSNSAIIAIGAVKFGNNIIDRFYRVVNLQSSIEAGLEMDASTVLWWMQQSEEAREQFKKPGLPLVSALEDFTKWLGEGAIVWGNGAAFDNTILANAYRKAGLERPWPFWGDMCYRTIKSMHPEIKMVRRGTHHNAVDDAESQALHLITILSD